MCCWIDYYGWIDLHHIKFNKCVSSFQDHQGINRKWLSWDCQNYFFPKATKMGMRLRCSQARHPDDHGPPTYDSWVKTIHSNTLINCCLHKPPESVDQWSFWKRFLGHPRCKNPRSFSLLSIYYFPWLCCVELSLASLHIVLLHSHGSQDFTPSMSRGHPGSLFVSPTGFL